MIQGFLLIIAKSSFSKTISSGIFSSSIVILSVSKTISIISHFLILSFFVIILPLTVINSFSINL